MKFKRFIVLVIVMFSFIHFSPQIIGATSEEITRQEVKEEELKKESADFQSNDQASDESTEPSLSKEEDSLESNEEAANSKEDDSGVEEVEKDSAQDEDHLKEKVIEGESKEEVEPEQEEPEEVNKTATEQHEKFSTKAASAPFQNGDRHDDIVDIKVKLNKIGYGGISETTLFGSWMETRIKQFQNYYGLSVTGKTDTETLKKLDEVYNNPFQEGKRHDDTVTIKEQLNQLGYGYITVSTLYGSFTETQVKRFQKDYGLKVNGIADAITRNKLNELVSSTNFKQGDRHEDIVDIKVKLNKIGYGGISETTFFGSWMETRVKQFQTYYGLPVTGNVDEAILKKLDEVYNSPFQQGKRQNDTVTLKDKLNKLGYGYISITTLYGSFMDKQVRSFQKDNGLKVNGIADEITRNKLNELASATDFKKGDRHIKIVDIKVKLNKIGYDNISETNYFGNWMETRVKQFQTYYGLSVTGRTDTATLKKLDEVYNSPFQQGKRHNDTVTLKNQLNELGYGYISVTTLYGSFMDSQIREFQKDYDLKVNGIADEITRNKLSQTVSNTVFKLGDRHANIPEIKEKLNRIGFGGISETTLYGSWMETRVKQFQAYYGLTETGSTNPATLKKLDKVFNSPLQQGKRHNNTIEFKEKLNQLGYGFITVTTFYGTYMEKQVKNFQRDNGLRVNGIIDEITSAKINNAVKNRVVKIFLDPGHGGHDPGGRGYGLNEKDIVLDIALKTANILTKQYIGVEVNLSRTTDKFVDLVERSKMANAWGADYFVSLHTNALNGSAHGFESFIYNGNVSKETKDRQSDIHNYLAGNIPVADRGKKQANFSVLRNSNMPAILLEYMFIDNRNENALLKSASYRSTLARMTAEAIAKSFNLNKR